MNKKKALIVSGGALEKDFLEKVFLSIKPDYLIAADSGLDHIRRLQLPVTHIVGDFDSSKKGTLDDYQGRPEIEIRKFNPVKDATDTEIALRLSLELGSSEITMLGCTGTRLDHVLGNIQLLVIAKEAGVRAELLDQNNRISLLEKETHLRKESQYGLFFSLFSLGEEVENLAIRGAKYPLEGYHLMPVDSRCVSNEILEEEVVITYDKGCLLLMETKD